MRPCFLAITSSVLARSLSNFRTFHFSPSADLCQYGLLAKNGKLGYLSLPRNVNLIYYPDGGCTRRPAGLDGSVGQRRWARPSLTPPTGRDPLGSWLSVVGRERGEHDRGCESRGFDAMLATLCQDRSCYWLYNERNWSRFAGSSSNRMIKKCEPAKSWHWVHWKCEISFRPGLCSTHEL